MRRLRWAAAAAVACMAVGAPTALASNTIVVYRSNVQPLPGNLPSVGGEAYAFSELGDEVSFQHRAFRRLKTVSVTMSSWACQQGSWYNADCVTHPGAKFKVPITLNLYNAAAYTPGSALGTGTLIASVTKTFKLPYRPSTSPKCSNGAWYQRHHGCFNGKAANIVFNFASLHLRLPGTVVFGVAYDTTHYGYDPIGQSAPCYGTSEGCPYDSLNIALGPEVRVGSKPFPDTLFQNAAYGSEYCDGGTVAQVNVFNLDSPGNACWGGYIPAVKFVAGRH
jgi:hypothetical protein